MCRRGTRPVLDRVQPTAIGSPPDSFRLREMASVLDSASVPSAERERGIEKTDELRRLKNARNRKFESISLQRRVRETSVPQRRTPRARQITVRLRSGRLPNATRPRWLSRLFDALGLAEELGRGVWQAFGRIAR